MSQLTIHLRSFSYKKGIPQDPSGNGGGFVFDCRGILNPGRIEKYKIQTGRDKGVIEYLESETQMNNFLKGIYQTIDICIENYISRNFEHLDINFGCTGGQHRSVYATDQTAKHIKQKYPETIVVIQHTIQEEKNWINESY